MQWSGLGYASLFHPARSSPWAVMGLLALPILSLLPALTLGMGALEAVVVALFPISASDAAMFERMDSGGWVAVLMASLIAPMVEEMLFRGIILRSFLNQYRRWPSIFGSALLFGLSHMNVYQGVVAFIGGIVMGWLYERTRSLWPSILLHAGYNTALMVELSQDNVIWPARWLVAILLAMAGTAMLHRLLLPRRR
jgi:hypothetical protein